MNRLLWHPLLALIVTFTSCTGDAQDITLTGGGSSPYRIIIPAKPVKQEQQAARILQKYVHDASGTQLAIASEEKRIEGPAIYIGNTGKAESMSPGKRKPESYIVRSSGKDIVICAGSGRGLTYGVYYFIEKYLHGKKLAGDPPKLVEEPGLKVPDRISDERRPLFIYRESYYPASQDAEYLQWNQLQRLDDLWGLWGHSFNKLVPAQTYFRSNPEYFALVKGKRQATQLCLSNENVFRIVKDELSKRIAKNPDAIYWSISPNDDNGYCTCDKCRAIDNEQGSPSGSLVRFVNRIAEAFPGNNFTTLAYGYTHKAPRNLKPASNVFVFLSDIDAYRDKPLAEEGSAAAFRSDLKAWYGLTKNIFIWDYVTQFTNYLAPFPNFHTLQPNMQFFRENGVKGIFAQGSGDTYGEWAELRSYVLAKLFQDDQLNVHELVASFMSDYYGKAAPYLLQYFDLVQEKMIASKRKLDIYGNPVNEWKSYLSPELLEQYSSLFDKAEGAVEGNTQLSDRVMRARLPLEFTVLQQMRFYGIEKHGFIVRDNQRRFPRPAYMDKIRKFVASCKKAGVTELSEGGLSPDQYLAEWEAIYAAGYTTTKALDATVSLKFPFAEDYPAKGNRTLVDGNPGYKDFSYNWLCFYGTPMVATVELKEKTSISTVKMHFLDDPRHWIFLPEKITVEVSEDGNTYRPFAELRSPANEEHYEVTVKEYVAKHASVSARYIRVTAANLTALPEWRQRDNKKPMIACDEIYVQ